jgi:hypothetical protein
MKSTFETKLNDAGDSSELKPQSHYTFMRLAAVACGLALAVGLAIGIPVGMSIDRNSNDDSCSSSTSSWVADTQSTPPEYWVQGTGLAITFSYNIEEGGQSSPLADPPISGTNEMRAQYDWGAREGGVTQYSVSL